MCRIHTKSWIFISEKIISHDFCTSFVLHKVKEAFGGSRWKLVELTRVSRYLAYVTRPHNWSISVFLQKIEKPHGGKNKALHHTKNLTCREKWMLLCNIRHGMCPKEV